MQYDTDRDFQYGSQPNVDKCNSLMLPIFTTSILSHDNYCGEGLSINEDNYL